MEKFLNPTTDICFKRLFGSKAHKNITIDFLNNVLERKQGRLITDVEFLDTYNQSNNIADRLSIVDVRCVDQEKKTYTIEVQVRPQYDFGARGQYYVARTLSSQLNPKQPFGELTPVIFIGVLDFVLFERHNRYISHHDLRDQFDGHNDLDLMELHFIELKKFTKKEDELMTDIDRWIFFLRYASEYMGLPKKVACGNNALVEAFDVVSQVNWSKSELEQYERLLDFERCEKSAITTAHETGADEKARDIARQMLAKGIDIKIIADVTGLGSEEIKKLK